MNLCSDKHYEVCYEGNECPACRILEDLQYEIDGLNNDLTIKEDEVTTLQSENDKLSEEIDNANQEIERLKDALNAELGE